MSESERDIPRVLGVGLCRSVAIARVSDKARNLEALNEWCQVYVCFSSIQHFRRHTLIIVPKIPLSVANISGKTTTCKVVNTPGYRCFATGTVVWFLAKSAGFGTHSQCTISKWA